MSYVSQFWAFWRDEGDQWFERNQDKPANEAVFEPLVKLSLPKKPVIVEVGCGDGRYIGPLQKAFQAKAIGIDPSAEALGSARICWPKVEFVRSSAYAINLYRADLIIFGFCLYLIDRENLFKTVEGADEALNDGGYLAVHDFDPPHPQVVPYHHKEGIFSYKMDYAALWLANPQYDLTSKTPTGDGTAMTILRKGTWDRWHLTQNT